MSRERPSNWNTVRKKVYKIDNYTCQNCGRKGGLRGEAELHAHHVVELSKGGTNKPSNLTTLCKGCHDSIHTSAMAPSAVKNNTHNTELGPVGEAIAEFIAILIVTFVAGLIGAFIGALIHPTVSYVLWILTSIVVFIYLVRESYFTSTNSESNNPSLPKAYSRELTDLDLRGSYSHELTDFGLRSENPTIVEDLINEGFLDQPVCENDNMIVYHVNRYKYRKIVEEIIEELDVERIKELTHIMIKAEKRYAQSVAETRSPIKKPLVIDARTFAAD